MAYIKIIIICYAHLDFFPTLSNLPELWKFISVIKGNNDYKNFNIYSKFSAESFREDVSIQNFNNKYESVDDQFNDFYWRLEGCAPLKKLKSKEIKLENKPWISDRR